MSTIYEIFGRDAHAMTIALMERAEVAAAYFRPECAAQEKELPQ